MKDAFGGVFNVIFIVLFLVIMIGILGLVVSYTKAFKMKNIIITHIENYEASGCFTQDSACLNKIKASAEGIGYGSRIKCPDDFTKIDGLFCYKEIISTNTSHILTYINLYLPIPTYTYLYQPISTYISLYQPISAYTLNKCGGFQRKPPQTY